jgi:hypothetical protein
MAVAAGAKLGPYEILALIGAGGMGEVYKARDTRLDRTVTIKVSQEKFSERFEREARAVAALNHPNICQLYDVGPDYLVMEYIEGTALKGPLPLDQVLKYAGHAAAVGRRRARLLPKAEPARAGICKRARPRVVVEIHAVDRSRRFHPGTQKRAGDSTVVSSERAAGQGSRHGGLFGLRLVGHMETAAAAWGSDFSQAIAERRAQRSAVLSHEAALAVIDTAERRYFPSHDG